MYVIYMDIYSYVRNIEIPPQLSTESEATERNNIFNIQNKNLKTLWKLSEREDEEMGEVWRRLLLKGIRWDECMRNSYEINTYEYFKLVENISQSYYIHIFLIL